MGPEAISAIGKASASIEGVTIPSVVAAADFLICCATHTKEPEVIRGKGEHRKDHHCSINGDDPAREVNEHDRPVRILILILTDE